MRQSVRRQFLFLRAYTIVTSTALVVMGAAAFSQNPPARDAAETHRATSQLSSMPTGRCGWCWQGRTECIPASWTV
jgi:hypothetical protein